MCQFFKKEKNPYKASAAFFLLVPLALLTTFNHNKEAMLASGLCFLSSAGSLLVGYALGKLKPCELAHVADNVVLQEKPADEMPQEQLEGNDQEEQPGIPVAANRI